MTANLLVCAAIAAVCLLGAMDTKPSSWTSTPVRTCRVDACCPVLAAQLSPTETGTLVYIYIACWSLQRYTFFGKDRT